MMLMLRAITSSWPQRLLGSLAMLLHALLHHHVFGSEMRAAFQTNMLTDLVPGMNDHMLPGQLVSGNLSSKLLGSA